VGNKEETVGAIERARTLGVGEKRKLAAKGREAIAFIRSMKNEIARAFYEIGRALLALEDDAVVAALGHPSFASLCQLELGMSPSQAARLMTIARSFSQREAGDLTAAKAVALVSLSRAIGGRTTARGLLGRRLVKVPGVGPIDVATAGAATIARAAKQARQTTRRPPTRGIKLSAEDERFVRQLRADARRDAKGAIVTGLAASAATGGRFYVKGYIRDARALGQALIRAATG
jgi:hypothetical protein